MGESIYLFYKHKFGQWRKMRNMVVDGVTYCCAEQYMMAEKARLFGDKDIEQAIMATKSPREHQRLGKFVSGFKQDVWDANAPEIVFRGNLAKFSQHADLRFMLLATNKAILAEASPVDRLWGIGLAEDDPRALNRDLWLGKNWLGGALMRVRDALVAQCMEEGKK